MQRCWGLGQGGGCALLQLIARLEASQRRGRQLNRRCWVGRCCSLPPVLCVLFFCPICLPFTWATRGSRTRAEELETKKTGQEDVWRKDCRLTEISLGPAGRFFWALLAYVCVMSPRVSRCVSHLAAGKKGILGPHWGWGMVLDWESSYLETPSPGGLFQLVPSRGPLFLFTAIFFFFFTAILIFFSLVLATDLSQPEKDNWLLVSFLRNFSHSPPFPRLSYLFLTRDCRSHRSHFLFFWNLFILRVLLVPDLLLQASNFTFAWWFESPPSPSPGASLPNTGLNTGLAS